MRIQLRTVSSLILRVLFLLIYNFLTTNCVSVKLAGSKTEKATGFEFTPPDRPFSKLDSPSADFAWRSSKTGNTIAVLTDCGPQADMSLSHLEVETLSVLTESKVLNKEPKIYNNRSALFTESEGLMDGVPVHMSFVSFQKNGCNFSLSYFGKIQFKENEISNFQLFVERFKAP